MARPRKAGERHPNGRLKKIGPEPRPGALIRRIVEAAEKNMADPRLGQPCGWLLLQREISDVQMAAATIYGKLRAGYDAAQGLPGRSARAIDMSSARGMPMETTAADKHRIASYEALRAGVMDLLGYDIGRRAIDVLDSAIVEQRAVPWADLTILKAGLLTVAQIHKIAGAGDAGKAKLKSLTGGVSVYPIRIGPVRP